MMLKQSASSTNWADDVEAEEAELGQAPPPADAVLHDRPSYATSPRSTNAPYPATLEYARGPGPTATLPDVPPFKAYLGNLAFDIEEDAVAHFFRGLAVVDVMVTRHRDTGRAKGCFVEFRTQRDLAEALKMDGMDLLRRSVRIQVAEPRQGGGRGPRDGGFFGGPPRSRGGGDDFGDGFSQGGPRRGGPPGGGRGGFSRFDDEGSRGGSGRWNAVRDVPVVEAQSPRERPKLNLQPRTQSAGLDAASGGALGEGATKSNPFGSAKPADTAAKLQELELRDAEQRKEAAAKRREEAEAARAPESAPATAPPAPPPAPAESTPAAQAEDQGGEFTAAGQRGGPVGGRGGRGAGRSDRGRVGGGPGRGRDRDRPPPGIGRPGSGSGGDGTLPHHRQGESLGRGGRGRGGRGDRPRGDAPGKAPRQVLAPTEDDVPKTKVANPYDLLATDE